MAEQPAQIHPQLRLVGDTWTLVVTLHDDRLDFEMEETNDPSNYGGHVSADAAEFTKALLRWLRAEDH